MQRLRTVDKMARVEACRVFIAMLALDRNFVHKIIFPDEAIFHLSGHVNKHNCVFWGSEPPGVVLEHVRNSPKVVVWCAVHSGGIIGPYFFDESTVGQNNYARMFENFC